MNTGRVAKRVELLDEQSPQAPTRTRAAALPPADRRAAIVAATLPLLLRHGPGVTTRQIAQAAGIAEGTIFRVFPDKDSLIEAVVDAALDPAPVDTALAAIDRRLPLDQRLVAAVEIIQRRFTEAWEVLTAVGRAKPRAVERRRPPDVSALASVFEPDGQRLNIEPTAAAILLRGLAFTNAHPLFAGEDPMAPAEIVSVLLDGIRC